ncbi:phage tail assembly chaperone, partial [Cronobacter turicensis]
MTTRFTLQPKPTFKADVKIPRAGDEDGVLTFTFKHYPLDQLAKMENLDEKT